MSNRRKPNRFDDMSSVALLKNLHRTRNGRRAGQMKRVLSARGVEL